MKISSYSLTLAIAGSLTLPLGCSDDGASSSETSGSDTDATGGSSTTSPGTTTPGTSSTTATSSTTTSSTTTSPDTDSATVGATTDFPTSGSGSSSGSGSGSGSSSTTGMPDECADLDRESCTQENGCSPIACAPYVQNKPGPVVAPFCLGEPEFIGCQSLDIGCDDVRTVACDGNVKDAATVICPDSCIPSDWVECDPPVDGPVEQCG